MRRAPLIVLLAALLVPAELTGYPLDGTAETGIQRLLGDAKRAQPTGALLPGESIRLHLTDRPDLEFDSLPQNGHLARGLDSLLRSRDPSYALVVVDFSDPNNVRWAGLRPDVRQNPGSVGKIVTVLALFNALASAFPEISDRQRVLRESLIRAGDWIHIDEHAVPYYDPDTGTNVHARLKPEDAFRLSEWIDHALSASANGAGSVLWRETMLLAHFGTRYPLRFEETEQFFRTTPKTELAALARRVVDVALEDAGLHSSALMQGSFWTRTGKAYVPGGQSYATPRELARYMFRMEQGRLVDQWTSLEIKKYLYVTKRRYRYVYAPELASAAVYFKSGSLYSCQAEEGFRCGKYMGNVRNLMNSVTTVESALSSADAPARPVRYTAALMSNVLRVNSAWDHSRIAAAVHTLVSSDEQVRLREEASERELSEVGRSE